VASFYGDSDRLNDAALEARDALDRWGHVTPGEFERMATGEIDFEDTLGAESSIPATGNIRPKALNCSAPSCSAVATADSEFCRAHNGEALSWFTVTRTNGRRVNVQAASQEEAERAVR
jgi:hypothetical protein